MLFISILVLDIYNIGIMKAKRKTLMIASILIMFMIGGFIVVQNGTNLFQGLDIYIFILIVILSIIVFVNVLKKDKDERAGIPTDDELSSRIKYKAGYYAFLSSMYMWMLIFFFKRYFPDVETMLGGGILLSAAISVGIKYYMKYNYNEE
jgi:preprotein translocase subunit SecG